MKIGIFTDSYLPLRDGVSTSVSTLSKQLKIRGHEVSVVAPKTANFKDAKNVIRLVAVRLFKRPEIWAGLEIPQPSLFKVLFMKFDIIHGHTGGPITQFGMHVARIKKVPFVVTYHTLWKHYKHYFFLPKLLKRGFLEKLSAIFLNLSDAVVAPSEKVKRELVHYGVKRPIHVIPSGVNIANFSYKSKSFLHKNLNIPRTEKIILTVGRLGKEKSMGFLIRAFAHALKLYPDMVFVIVGEGRVYDKHKLVRLADSLNVAEKVIFAGRMEFYNMPKVYAGSDLFVFASYTETQGMVIMEALASGVPVLAVSDQAFIGVIENAVNGYMVDRNIRMFAKKLAFIMRDADHRWKMGKNAKRSAEVFSVEHTAEALVQVYSKCLRENTAGKTENYHADTA